MVRPKPMPTGRRRRGCERPPARGGLLFVLALAGCSLFKAPEAQPEVSRAALRRGVALATQGKVDEAIREFRSAADLDPGNGEAFADLGILLDRTGKPEEALEALKHAVEVDVRHPVLQNDLAAAYLKRGQGDLAIYHFRRAASLDPTNTAFAWNLAGAYAHFGKLDLAAEEYQRLTQRMPEDPRVWLRYGGVLTRIDRFPEAEAACGKAASLAAKSAAPQACLAVLSDREGNEERARSLFLKAIDLDASDLMLRLAYAAFLHRRGELREAQAQYTQMIDRAERPEASARLAGRTVAEAHFLLGAAREDAGETLEAQDEYLVARTLDPELAGKTPPLDPDAHLALGIAFQARFALVRAVDEYRTTLKLRSDDPRALRRLGECLLKQAELGVAPRGASEAIEEAVRVLDSAVKVDPNAPLAHYDLGVAYYRQGMTGAKYYRRGKFLQAIAELHKAIQLNPTYAPPIVALAIIHDQQGDLGRAAVQYQNALKADPSLHQLHLLLASIYDRESRPADAQAEIRALLALEPANADAHYALALLLEKAGKRDQADQEYLRAERAR